MRRGLSRLGRGGIICGHPFMPGARGGGGLVWCLASYYVHASRTGTVHLRILSLSLMWDGGVGWIDAT